MKRPFGPSITGPISANYLSVSPVEEDHTALERILNDAARVTPLETPWQLSRAQTLASALSILRRVEHAVVMCERDLECGNWRDLLGGLQQFTNPPSLIVTSRLADEYLWAEALNLGAYDVLAKPFCPAEAVRVVNLACLRWQRERRQVGPRLVAGTAKVKSASIQ
jgi:DNA-binding response OmpR family regulator